MKDTKLKYCNKCKKKTQHIKRGFGEVGSIVGNARWSCLRCEGKEMEK